MCTPLESNKEEGVSVFNGDVLVTFLKQTQEGKYAKIEEGAMPYKRLVVAVQETREDDYYYSIHG